MSDESKTSNFEWGGVNEPICKVCGHHADDHRFRVPEPICTKCPDRSCQDGPDGERYRTKGRP